MLTSLMVTNPKSRKRTYRTNSLIRELKSMAYPFEYLGKDKIQIRVKSQKDPGAEYILNIYGQLDCYRMGMHRRDHMNTLTHSYTWQLRAASGIELLINLVQRQILPPYFMPLTSINRIIDEA